MNSLNESFIYYSVKALGSFIRLLPVRAALDVGRILGFLAYHFDIRHKALAYANLKIAFARTKTPDEIKRITKTLFCNYGQNLIELMRLPLMTPEMFREYVRMEGTEHIQESLKQKKGVILLAMHFGSWELASLASAMIGHPYKVIVKPQKRFSRLDELLNSYRECGGSVVIARGLGTREFVKSLRCNEVVGMVVDQGGRDGVLVPFFDRQASMSVGAIRMGLKLGVPICFAIIIRQKGPYHKMIIHPPLKLKNTGETERDIHDNLRQVTQLMEHYIREFPQEHMWFYKIWKYSKESITLILDDGKTGHLRQSQAVAAQLKKALNERQIDMTTQHLTVSFQNGLAQKIFPILSLLAHHFLCQGRLGFLRRFLTKESFSKIMSVKADFIISCGSSTAAVNYLLSNDQQAKGIVILKPGVMGLSRFDLAVLPHHDLPARPRKGVNIVAVNAAPNLITPQYLEDMSRQLLNHFSHLKRGDKFRIGVLIGGDTKDYVLKENKIRMVAHQILEAACEINAEILVTTSRRTPPRVEALLSRELKKNPRCVLFINPKQDNVPEAVGGILGLSDIVIVSGDSISMISEAAASGKKTIIFPVKERQGLALKEHKHTRFLDTLNAQGHILSSSPCDIKQSIYSLAKDKITLQKIDDNEAILKGLRQII